MRGLLVAPLSLLLAGCVGFEFNHDRVGLPGAVEAAKTLEVGKTTLRETLARLGPPDLILPVGQDVNRAWYTCWSADYFKFILKLSLPFANNTSVDLFIFTLGSEELRLARLEFDRDDMLVHMQTGVFRFDRTGQFFGVDNSLATNFLEDRDRALDVRGDDDADDDP